MDQYAELKQGEKGAWLSIAAYIFLSFVKLSVGYLAGSEALIADGLNNTTDIIASIAVLIGLKIARKPPDQDHPYGHYRAQTIAALIASFIMVTVGLQVIGESIFSFFDTGDHQMPDMLAAWTALASAALMYGVYQYNVRLARRINNMAIMAAAQDNRSDMLVSIGAFIGIVGSQFGYPQIDSITAFIVGVIICKTAWEIFRDASHSLTDGFDENELNIIKETIHSTPGVDAIHDIKARLHGNTVLVDVVIHVDPNLSVLESHQITEDIEQRMIVEHKITHVHVHVEPLSSSSCQHS
ncbi:cation diffusion facilitator family transporter [Brevibacillus dissolubilis]|uniref:cation diffusion facilitator family transporter n=1 Tax=Brevibacillus dissolubilis TaxID=1844116 RepID=UPI001117659E|nr:cation diffusion facilitator family transporter [Brevibacillus dissolubilis]